MGWRLIGGDGPVRRPGPDDLHALLDPPPQPGTAGGDGVVVSAATRAIGPFAAVNSKAAHKVVGSTRPWKRSAN